MIGAAAIGKQPDTPVRMRADASVWRFHRRGALTRPLILLWLAFVTVISMMPLRLKSRVGTTGLFHTPGHFLIFFVTSMLLCRTENRRLLRWTAVCAFALGLEILEWRIYRNEFEWRDVLVDIMGAAMGLLVISVFPSRARYHHGAEEQNTG